MMKSAVIFCLVVAALGHDGNCGGQASRLYNLPAGAETIMAQTRRALRTNAPLAYTNPLSSSLPSYPINQNLPVSSGYSAPISSDLPLANQPISSSYPASSSYSAPISSSLPVRTTYSAPVTSSLPVSTSYSAPISSNLPLANQPISSNLPVSSSYSVPISSNLPLNSNLGFNSESPSPSYVAPVASAPVLPERASYPVDHSNLGFSSQDTPINQIQPMTQSLPVSQSLPVNQNLPTYTNNLPTYTNNLPVSSSLPISPNVIPMASSTSFIRGEQAPVDTGAEVQTTQVEEQHPIQTPVQEPVQVPAQEPIQEPIVEPVQEPVQVPVEEPQQQIQEPVPVQAPEPVRADTKSPLPPPTKGGSQRFLSPAASNTHFTYGGVSRSMAATTLDLPSGADQITDGSITINFNCAGLSYGYYADVENQCQIFHICQPINFPTGESQMQRVSFVCPVNTQFDQQKSVCVAKDAENLTPCHMSYRFFGMTAQRFAPPAFYRSITPSATFFRSGGVKGAPVGPIVQEPAPIPVREILQVPVQVPMQQPIREIQPAPTKTIVQQPQPVREVLPAPTKTVQQPIVSEPIQAPVTTFRGGVKGRMVRATGGVKGGRKGYRMAQQPIILPARKVPVQAPVTTFYRADPIKQAPTRFSTGSLVSYGGQRAYNYGNYGSNYGGNFATGFVQPLTQPLNLVTGYVQHFPNTMTNTLSQPLSAASTIVPTRSNLPLSPAMRLGVVKNA